MPDYLSLSAKIQSALRHAVARARTIAPERLLLGLLFVAALGLWIWVGQAWPRPLKVMALAVGDGDCFLISAPSGKTVLIDGGSRFTTDVGQRIIVPNLMLAGVRRIDYMMISHPDADHLNGMPAVLNSLPVGMLIDPQIPSENTEYQRLVTVASNRKIPIMQGMDGERIDLGEGVKIYLLAPAHPLLQSMTPGEFTNNNSIVCMLVYRQARMLFTGDLETAGEEALLSRYDDLHANVLKVAHHGSAKGTGEAFLERVQPEYALISCQGGTSIHPSPPVLARLRAHGARILRTDVSGQLLLTTDGYKWRIKGFRDNDDESK